MSVSPDTAGLPLIAQFAGKTAATETFKIFLPVAKMQQVYVTMIEFGKMAVNFY